MGADKISKLRKTATTDEIFFIFEKVLDNWSTIKIYNTIKQNNVNSSITKKTVEKISTGNCKINKQELSNDKYEYYISLREKIYNKT